MSVPSSQMPMIPTAGDPAEPDDLDQRELPDQPELDAGQLDLEERHALRRVAGLSTELQDVTEVEYRELRLERVVLMGVWTDGTLATAENSLRELSRLAETAGSQVLDGLIQRRSRPDTATYVGAGKAPRLAERVASTGADTVICDGELAASQLRRLEGIVRVKVVDRTALILDIFAQHARSKEGKAQGELAELAVGREVQRGQRRRREVPSVAIAGYTNAGKSSLLNRLTGAHVLVDDSLFATLDPAGRRARAPPSRSPAPGASSGICRISSSTRSGPHWKRSPTRN